MSRRRGARLTQRPLPTTTMSHFRPKRGIAQLAVLQLPLPRSPRNSRTLFGFARKAPKSPPGSSARVLAQDDLFHPLSTSPIPAMREKAARIKSMAKCPVTRLPVNFDCPHCGYPTHASEQAWESDPEKYKYWTRLREANEDEHDLRSGRKVEEFELPGAQPYEEAVSMGNWDLFFYTRGFGSIDDDRSRRHVSKLLTYPITIGAVLHEFSPYTLRNQRLTPNGLRSLHGQQAEIPLQLIAR